MKCILFRIFFLLALEATALTDLVISFDFFVQRLAPFENFSAETNYTFC